MHPQEHILINTQPRDQILLFGEKTTLFVEVPGADIAYQWSKDGRLIDDGQNISGSQTDTLTINCFTLEDEGAYIVKCYARNQSETMESNQDKLRLNRKSSSCCLTISFSLATLQLP